jgi:type VI secretion system protein ImpA
MPTPEVLDFAKLLAPIPGDMPTGVDLRADPSPESEFQKIREARKRSRNSERSLEVPPDNEEERKKIDPPVWGDVLGLGKKILAEKSKDLEVTAYMTEALVRQARFAGLRDGYRLARELIGQFWEGIYPPPEDSDTEMRFKLLLDLAGVGTTGALIAPLRKLPMTEETSLGAFSLSHYTQALALDKVPDPKVRQQKIDKGTVPLKTIKDAVAETPASFYADLIDDVTQAIAEIKGFCDGLKEKSQYEAPSSEIVGVLDECLAMIKDVARDKLPKAPPPGAAPAAEAAAAATAPQAPAAPADAGAIKSREDAFGRLKKVADYFREHEPQSIIPYALEQVSNWGKMSLPELLSELIADEGARKNLFKQVGIKPPEVKK